MHGTAWRAMLCPSYLYGDKHVFTVGLPDPRNTFILQRKRTGFRDDLDLQLDKELGEHAEPGEADTDQLIADTIAGYINRRYSDGRRPSMRDAHAKAHGCVGATFDVDTGLPHELRQGVFVPGDYQAWIRFSMAAK